MKKKGFTLVELLAVIVILAIILIIAVPTVLGIIDDANKESFRNSVRGIFKAIELYTVKNDNVDLLSPHLISELELSNDEFINGIWYMENDEIVVEHIGTRKLSSPYVKSSLLSSSFEVIKGSYGNGELSEALLNALDSPLKDQACIQTSCYGFYSTDGCTMHDGTDFITGTSNATLHALADGEVTYISRNNAQCTPDFSTPTICGSGCEGNVITIRYTLDLGEDNPTVIYSTYRHLASFADGIEVGSNVFKGEEVGIMGTSGCSTGVHTY